jgi:APA family basic amino acid/polyamine antiporter
VFLRQAWPRLVAFLYGWTRFWIGSPASIAAYGVASATFASGFIDTDLLGGRTTLAVVLVWIFTLLNCSRVEVGGGMQAALTALKVLLIAGLAALVFVQAPQGNWQRLVAHESFSAGKVLSTGFGAAVLSALWAFDGWNSMPMAAGEIRDGQRNVPRALFAGMVIVTITYMTANLAWFLGASFDEIATANSSRFPDALPAATKAVRAFVGDKGVAIVSFAFVVSALGAMNGSILTGARVPYAMAVDGVFPEAFARIGAKTGVPVISILVQGVVSSLLAASGSFDQLTDYVVFSSWIFYAVAAAGLFKLRRTHAQFDGYRVKFFPAIPLLFICMSCWLMVQAILSDPKACAVGALFILMGVPFYLLGGRKLPGMEVRG